MISFKTTRLNKFNCYRRSFGFWAIGALKIGFLQALILASLNTLIVFAEDDFSSDISNRDGESLGFSAVDILFNGVVLNSLRYGDSGEEPPAVASYDLCGERPQEAFLSDLEANSTPSSLVQAVTQAISYATQNVLGDSDFTLAEMCNPASCPTCVKSSRNGSEPTTPKHCEEKCDDKDKPLCKFFGQASHTCFCPPRPNGVQWCIEFSEGKKKVWENNSTPGGKFHDLPRNNPWRGDLGRVPLELRQQANSVNKCTNFNTSGEDSEDTDMPKCTATVCRSCKDAGGVLINQPCQYTPYKPPQCLCRPKPRT